MLTIEQIAHREYLKSATWKDIRELVLKRDNHKCICGNTGYDIHHKNYKNWGNEKLKDLITLCRTCHESIHSAQKGTRKNKSIGNRAIWGYLTMSQKESIVKKFDLLNNCELYYKIIIYQDNAICKYSSFLLGYSRWYSQCPKYIESSLKRVSKIMDTSYLNINFTTKFKKRKKNNF